MRQTLIVLLALLALAAPAGAVTAPTVQVRSSQFGRILFDGRGYVLYAFTADKPGRSVCAGACAKAWPPYVVRQVVRSGLVGTTRRADGRLQVTYKGRPLYHYVGDRQPGQILCQDVEEFGGRWLVVRGSGALVR